MEFAWRKTKPSHKMRFKTNDDSFINRRKLQISGARKYHTWKPTDGVISSEIYLSYSRRFLVFIQQRDLLLCNRLCGSVGGGRCGCSIILHTSHHHGPRGNNITDDEGSLVNFTKHDVIGASAVQHTFNEKR
jgi:hypothetical protein